MQRSPKTPQSGQKAERCSTDPRVDLRFDGDAEDARLDLPDETSSADRNRREAHRPGAEAARTSSGRRLSAICQHTRFVMPRAYPRVAPRLPVPRPP
jgi:hypothetical protein